MHASWVRMSGGARVSARLEPIVSARVAIGPWDLNNRPCHHLIHVLWVTNAMRP